MLFEVYLGNPSLNFADYTGLEATLKAAFQASSAIPTKLVLPIFTQQNDGADKTEKPGATTSRRALALTVTCEASR